ncbi:hypothetical protein F3Y22_tig00110195pilonHSYRG00008 [Hibiscus syriacus]|uniref:Uncharacterized protein n=1 Tax=Hibiscus syriacus TaxID=106335 RepID=A0A6A3BG95_HIBSY|nr:hypothetical protein F3Y22_tig00110195pilonHSYRG00008 [Hibiscus syriacus]
MAISETSEFFHDSSSSVLACLHDDRTTRPRPSSNTNLTGKVALRFGGVVCIGSVGAQLGVARAGLVDLEILIGMVELHCGNFKQFSLQKKLKMMALNFARIDPCQYKSHWEMKELLKRLRTMMLLSWQMGLQV